MKKVLATLLVLVFASTFIFANGGKEASSDKPIVIEFWTHEDVNRQKLEDRYIQEFIEMHPNVTVNVTRQAAAKLIELVQTAFAAGSGPTMFNLSINEQYPLMAAGRVAPMNYQRAGYKNAKDVINAYMPGMLDPVTMNGEVYGLPLELTNWAIFVNDRMMKAAGLDPEKDWPKTWEEMVEVSSKLVKRNGDILTARGFDFRYPYYLEWLVPMVEQKGGALISADGKEAIVGEKAWVDVLTFLQQWGPNGKNLGSPTYTAARSAFNRENGVAMANTGLYQEARIKADNPSFYDSGDWRVVPFPTFKDAVNDRAACYYGHYYMVNADADKETQAMAWELIAYMLSHGEEYLSEVGLIQPTNALMNSKTYADMPYSQVFKDDFARAHIVYHAANSTELNQLIRTAVEAVMLQGVDPKTAYQNLKKQAQEVLDEK